MHVRAGFRAVLRQPALVVGEIAWRWAFGVAAWTLVILAIHRILARVDVTQTEVLIARHSDWFQIADACARILVQVLPQFARECLVLIPAIAVLWIAAATLGRALTLQAILSAPSLLSTAVILSEAASAGVPAGAAESKDPYHLRTVNPARTHFGRLALLNILRALFTIATFIAFFGALFLAGMAFSTRNPAIAIVVGICLAALIGFFWSVVNWFLALAPIWTVRDGRATLSSVRDSVDLHRRSPGPSSGIALWFAVFRATALAVASIAALIAGQASPAAAIALCVVIALVYFALADFFYIARLAAFVALDEGTQPSAINIQAPAPEPSIPTSESSVS